MMFNPNAQQQGQAGQGQGQQQFPGGMPGPQGGGFPGGINPQMTMQGQMGGMMQSPQGGMPHAGMGEPMISSSCVFCALHFDEGLLVVTSIPSALHIGTRVSCSWCAVTMNTMHCAPS
jgi:hypothetical protein